jgi:hypothetical protein
VVKISDKAPRAGLAEIPENPSEPPHFSPTFNFWIETGVLLSLFMSINPLKVSLMAADIIACSVP